MVRYLSQRNWFPYLRINKDFDLSSEEKQEYDLYIKEYEFYEKKILNEFDSKHI